MGLHELTAGHRYTYLTRQVAAHDSTERGHASLGDYYSEAGESPGRKPGPVLGRCAGLPCVVRVIGRNLGELGPERGPATGRTVTRRSC
jgi:hypothetical protein